MRNQHVFPLRFIEIIRICKCSPIWDEYLVFENAHPFRMMCSLLRKKQISFHGTFLLLVHVYMLNSLWMIFVTFPGKNIQTCSFHAVFFNSGSSVETLPWTENTAERFIASWYGHAFSKLSPWTPCATNNAIFAAGWIASFVCSANDTNVFRCNFMLSTASFALSQLKVMSLPCMISTYIYHMLYSIATWGKKLQYHILRNKDFEKQFEEEVFEPVRSMGMVHPQQNCTI